MVPFLIFLFLDQRIIAAQDLKAITAELGQDITLKCRAPNNNILAGVEWSRPDLEPEYVLLLRDGHFIPEDQQPSFKNRVDLQDKQMKGGDVSLILKNVTDADAGTYECRVLTQGGKRRKRAVETIRVINLSVVDPPGQPGGSVGLKVGMSVFAVVLVAVAVAAVGFFTYKKCGMQRYQAAPAQLQPV